MISKSIFTNILQKVRKCLLFPKEVITSKPFQFWGHYTHLAIKHCANSKYHLYLVGSPYEWDKTTNTKLVLTNSKWRLAWWKFNLLICLIMWFSFIGICIKTFLNGELDIKSPLGIMRGMACLVTLLVMLLACTILINLRTMVELLNCLLQSYEDFKDKHDSTYSIWRDLFGAFAIFGITTGLRFTIFGFHLLYIIKCDASMFGTLLPQMTCENGNHLSQHMILFWLILQHYFLTVGLETYTIYVFTFVPIIQLGYQVTKKLGEWPSKQTPKFPIKQYISIYREFQLITKFANQIFSKYLMPGHLIILGTIVIGACYFEIRIKSDLMTHFIPISSLMVSIAYFITLLYPMAEVSTRTFNLNTRKFECLSSRTSCSKKVFASCSPFGIRIGSQFILTKHAVFLYLYHLLDALLTLLIATK